MRSDPPSPRSPTPPPPWRLDGAGFVFALRFPSGYLRASGALPASLPPGCDDTLGVLVYADYAASPVGPYRELALLVGPVEGAGRRGLTAAKVYVSSAASVEAGRMHWGLPKVQADFQLVRTEAGALRVVVLRGGLAEVDATFEPGSGPALPAPAFLLPSSWRTLLQPREGGLVGARLGGWGRLRRARLADFRSVPYLFPDLKPGQGVAGLHLPRLTLRLPDAAPRP